MRRRDRVKLKEVLCMVVQSSGGKPAFLTCKLLDLE
jgi:hypothetical protein